METFFTFLEKRVSDCSSPLCIDLGPHGAASPMRSVKEVAASSMDLVRLTARYAAAFKVDAAFYQAHETAGIEALQQVVAEIQAMAGRQGSMMPLILDLHHGELAPSAGVLSIFHSYRACALLLPLAQDRETLDALLINQEKGLFLWCAARGLEMGSPQDSPLDLGPWESIAAHARVLNTRNNVGLAVERPQAAALRVARAAAAELWILAPEVEQDELPTMIQAGRRQDGTGLLISMSADIARSSNPAVAVAEMRDALINLTYWS